MEDARTPILPPEATANGTVSLTEILELFLAATGLRWARLILVSRSSGKERVVSIGRTGGPSVTVGLDIGERVEGRLTIGGESPPPARTLELLAAGVGRELQRLRLIAETALLQNAANAADASVLIFGPRGDILFANHLADQLISRQTEEELTVHVNGGSPQPLFRLLCTRVGELRDTSVGSRWSDRIDVSDGSEVSCELAVLPEVDERGHRAVIAILRALSPPTEQRLDEFAALHHLSPREREVLQFLVQGLDTPGLAEGLGISPHTVRDHLKNIFQKTATKSRSELLSALSGTSNPVSG
jgi:DNA-binding CsgD family transcriptional regulator